MREYANKEELTENIQEKYQKYLAELNDIPENLFYQSGEVNLLADV